VSYLSALEVRSRRGAIQIHVYHYLTSRVAIYVKFKRKIDQRYALQSSFRFVVFRNYRLKKPNLDQICKYLTPTVKIRGGEVIVSE